MKKLGLYANSRATRHYERGNGEVTIVITTKESVRLLGKTVGVTTSTLETEYISSQNTIEVFKNLEEFGHVVYIDKEKKEGININSNEYGTLIFVRIPAMSINPDDIFNVRGRVICQENDWEPWALATFITLSIGISIFIITLMLGLSNGGL